jgi:tRNA nucleotidyltransferase (CCA-adding enzyme)
VGAITRTDLLRHLYSRTHRAPAALIERNFSVAEPRRKWIVKLMEERLPEEILRLLKVVGKKGQELGFQTYAVGGFVRDLILRFENLDIDVVVEGEGIFLARSLAREMEGELKVHKRFGTATLTFPKGHHLDVATARLEYYDYPAALPRVEHSSIKLDLYRRDFTVNTLAVHLNPGHFGELIDFFGAQRDLKDRVIRVLHNLSFVEDPTRIFRAIRFEQRMGFQLAKHTHMLLENAVRMQLLARLSGKRLFQELRLCLGENSPYAVLKRLGDYGVLKYFHPKLIADPGVENCFQRLESVLSWFNLLFTGEPYERWFVFFLGMVDPLSEKDIQEILARLALGEKFRQHFMEKRRSAKQVGHRLAHPPEPGRSDLYFLLHPIPTDFLLYAMGATESASVQKAISLYFTELKKTKVALTGKDLKRLGYIPGPIYTEILQEVLRAKLNGELATLQDEIRFAQHRFSARKEVFLPPAGKGGQKQLNIPLSSKERTPAGRARRSWGATKPPS